MENKTDVKAYFLMKIGKKEHMEQFLNNGVVYMNSVSFFRDCTNNEQGDFFEGAQKIKNGKVISWRRSFSFEKIFCMWHLNNISPLNTAESIIRNNYNEIKASYDLRKYGGFADDKNVLRVVIIHNVKEFHNRLRDRLDAMGFHGKYASSHVSYYDPFVSNDIEVNAFMKPCNFSKQNEIRYWVFDNNEKPLIVELGDISDIAQMHPLDSLLEVKFNVENNELFTNPK